jgi:hypothetical protein
MVLLWRHHVLLLVASGLFWSLGAEFLGHCPSCPDARSGTAKLLNDPRPTARRSRPPPLPSPPLPPGRCPRVPPPPRSSQFSRPRSSRPATSALFAVLSAASRASHHHFALRSSPGRVHCVLPPPRAARSRRPRPVRRADASCARAPRASGDGTLGAVRKARRVLGQLGASATGARREGAQRDEDLAGARRRAVSCGRENGGRQVGRSAHGAGAHGDRVRARGRGCVWRRGSGREARVDPRLDGREGAVVARDARAGGGGRSARARGGVAALGGERAARARGGVGARGGERDARARGGARGEERGRGDGLALGRSEA